MTKLAYLECPTGLAGDMCLGALVHAGVPLEYLVEKLSLLGITHEYDLWAELVHRNGQQATKVHVDLVSAHRFPHGSITKRGDRSDQTSQAAIKHFPDPNNSAHAHHDQSHLSEPDHAHAPDHAHPHPTAIESPNQELSDQPPAAAHAQAPANTHAHAHARHLPEIETLIQSANLPDRVQDWSLRVFRQLAAAEGAVHGIAPEQVHFHEVGATDAIVDIVGSCLGFDWLGIDQVYCSAMPIGGGTVRAAHGLLPVPAPAVLKLLEMRQVPIYSNGINRELVTPTGAAIVTALATRFGPPPAMHLHRVGLGAGSRDLPIPNMVRLWLGTTEPDLETRSDQRATTHEATGAIGRNHSQAAQPLSPQAPAPSQPAPHRHTSRHTSPNNASPCLETITILETQIDDLNPQAIGYVFEALLAVGALDVFTQAIGMKKSRPGVLLTVVCYPQQADACEAVIFRETSTLGIRRSQQQRTALQRQFQTVDTPYGSVQIKLALRGAGAIVDGQPEYEDCAKLAREFQVPWQEVYRLALHQWYAQTQSTASTPY